MMMKTPDTTAPILAGEIDIKEYSIQGKTFKGRKPCFDYEINLAVRKFQKRWDFYRDKLAVENTMQLIEDEDIKKVIKYLGVKGTTAHMMSIQELAELDEKVKKAIETKDDFEVDGLSKKVKELSRINDKLSSLKENEPVLHYKYTKFLGDLINDGITATELFVLDRNNLKALMEVMLEGEVRVVEDVYSEDKIRRFVLNVQGENIDMNPNDAELQEELEKVGVSMLNHFFTFRQSLRNIQN